MTTRGVIKTIIKRDGQLVPYDRDRIATAIFRAMVSIKKPDRALADLISLDVERALAASYGDRAIPSVEEIQDIVEKVLEEKGFVDTARAYTTYRSERAQARSARAHSFEANDNIPYKRIYEVLLWNINRACDTIEGLNRIMANGSFKDLIADSDRRFDSEIERCARGILDKRGRIRVIIVAGPSSSGKTTTTMKIGEKLMAAGFGLKSLVVDNYFFDLEKHPRDEFGDYDYESPRSLDLELINRHLAALLAGDPVMTPEYNFKTGKRTLNAREMRLDKKEILLLDSLHGLYGEMTSGIPPECIFKIYVETLGQLRSADNSFMRWADNRLMRRMIRDQLHRNSRPMETLTHWHYVRRSELKHIIPFIASADMLLNSALPYEIPVLKHLVFKHFPEAVARFRSDPHRQDAYIRAKRIAGFLEPLQEFTDIAAIPADSLLREFIGGSKYGC